MNQHPHLPFIGVAFGYLIKYAGYYLFPLVVLFTLAPILGAYINIWGPEMPFLQYISFMLPDDAEITIGNREIMRLYSLTATLFFLLSIIGSRLAHALKQYRGGIVQPEVEHTVDEDDATSDQTPDWRIKRRLKTNIIVISVSYAAFFATLPFATIAEETNLLLMYLILTLIYLYTLIMSVGYIVIDTISNRLIAWAASYL